MKHVHVACAIDADVIDKVHRGKASSTRTRYDLSVAEALRRHVRRVDLVAAVDDGTETLDALARLRPDIVFNLAFSAVPVEASFVRRRVLQHEPSPLASRLPQSHRIRIEESGRRGCCIVNLSARRGEVQRDGDRDRDGDVGARTPTPPAPTRTARALVGPIAGNRARLAVSSCGLASAVVLRYQWRASGEPLMPVTERLARAGGPSTIPPDRHRPWPDITAEDRRAIGRLLAPGQEGHLRRRGRRPRHARRRDGGPCAPRARPRAVRARGGPDKAVRRYRLWDEAPDVAVQRHRRAPLLARVPGHEAGPPPLPRPSSIALGGRRLPRAAPRLEGRGHGRVVRLQAALSARALDGHCS